MAFSIAPVVRIYQDKKEVIMPYTFGSKVRYSECDSEGALTPFSVINYFQDCSTFQSERLGVGIEHLADRKRAWFLNSWSISFDRYPVLGEEIETGTFAHSFSGIYGYRHFYIKGGDGRLAVRADSIWFCFDTVLRAPCKPLAEDIEPYMEEDADKLSLELGLPPIKRKIPMPEGGDVMGELCVTRHLLDSNDHMNNAWYVDIASEAAGIEHPSSLRVEYRRAAVLGNIIIPVIVRKDDCCTIGLKDRDGGIYAVAELRA